MDLKFHARKNLNYLSQTFESTHVFQKRNAPKYRRNLLDFLVVIKFRYVWAGLFRSLLIINYISKNTICNLWHQPIIAKMAKYLIPHFYSVHFLLTWIWMMNWPEAGLAIFWNMVKLLGNHLWWSPFILKLPTLAMSITFVFL